jgi:hypothetical protein
MHGTLRRGSRGPEVRQLQALLNSKCTPRPNLVPDAVFGTHTEVAVRRYQATVGLGIDGIAGPRTWQALENGTIANPAGPGHVPATFSDAPWMAVAMREIGRSEVPGPQHNPHILAYHATTSLRATTDETAWCSSFVNWCLVQAGISGTNSAAAASWLHWGAPSSARSGAVTIPLWRTAVCPGLAITWVF